MRKGRKSETGGGSKNGVKEGCERSTSTERRGMVRMGEIGGKGSRWVKVGENGEDD